MGIFWVVSKSQFFLATVMSLKWSLIVKEISLLIRSPEPFLHYQTAKFFQYFDVGSSQINHLKRNPQTRLEVKWSSGVK